MAEDVLKVLDDGKEIFDQFAPLFLRQNIIEMVSPGDEQDDPCDAVSPTPERFTGAPQPPDPGIWELQRKPSNRQHDETGQEHEMLPAPGAIHPQNGPRPGTIIGAHLLGKTQAVTSEH